MKVGICLGNCFFERAAKGRTFPSPFFLISTFSQGIAGHVTEVSLLKALVSSPGVNENEKVHSSSTIDVT